MFATIKPHGATSIEDVLAEIAADDETAAAVPLRKFTFYVEGVGRDVEVIAETEREAHQMAWGMLSEGERNAAESLDCVDEVAA